MCAGGGCRIRGDATPSHPWQQARQSRRAGAGGAVDEHGGGLRHLRPPAARVHLGAAPRQGREQAGRERAFRKQAVLVPAPAANERGYRCWGAGVAAGEGWVGGIAELGVDGAHAGLESGLGHPHGRVGRRERSWEHHGPKRCGIFLVLRKRVRACRGGGGGGNSDGIPVT